jgi:hypothetical protein
MIDGENGNDSNYRFYIVASAMLAEEYVLIVPFAYHLSLGLYDQIKQQNITSTVLTLQGNSSDRRNTDISSAESPGRCVLAF